MSAIMMRYARRGSHRLERTLIICVDLLTCEYPPLIYGGAGVHVLELAKVFHPRIEDLRVQVFDGPRKPGTEGVDPGVTGHAPLAELEGTNAVLKTLGTDLSIAVTCGGTDLVHSYTWYVGFAGHLASLLHGAPHVISTHSLEPLCPWKVGQFDGDYRVPSYVEKTTHEVAAVVVATSNGMYDDILHCHSKVDSAKVRVTHNGINLTRWKAPEGEEGRELRTHVLAEHDTDSSRRIVVFVGRITRQKGLSHFLWAARLPPEDVQIVLCVGASDAPEITAEVDGLVSGFKKTCFGVVPISETLFQSGMTAILDSTNMFIASSAHGPPGIASLEAMASGLLVIGTAIGGVLGVVADRQTGYLASIEQMTDGTGVPFDPEHFEHDMAERLITVLDDEVLAERTREAELAGVRGPFSWDATGVKTVALYFELV